MLTQTVTSWAQICADPDLQDLPYKVEMNASGQIILSPHTHHHGILQSLITDLLYALIDRPGHRAVGYPVETPEGTKVPDVAWISAERYDQVPAEAADSPIMPELCVEVLSDSNLQSEINQKRRLHLDGGAEEVWIVSIEGEVTFFGPEGQRPASELVEGFPAHVEA